MDCLYVVFSLPPAASLGCTVLEMKTCVLFILEEHEGPLMSYFKAWITWAPLTESTSTSKLSSYPDTGWSIGNQHFHQQNHSVDVVFLEGFPFPANISPEWNNIFLYPWTHEIWISCQRIAIWRFGTQGRFDGGGLYCLVTFRSGTRK